MSRIPNRTPDASFSGQAESFTYAATGQRQAMTDASGITNYTYTARDQIAAKATPQGTLTYTYDPAGNATTVLSSNANGTNAAYSWDANNRLASVSDIRALIGGAPGVTSYQYDPTNQLTSMVYPNGVSHSFVFDNRDRATGLSVTRGATVFASYTQNFSGTGRKQSVIESGGRSSSYTYDPIYRLLNESIAGDTSAANNGSLSYSLDAVGNRQSLVSTLAALPGQNFSYDANDRLTADTSDANGNTLISSGMTYAYDFADRLVSATGGPQSIASIVYDGDGNRVGETVAGVTTRFLVDTQSTTGYPQVAEEIVGGAVTANYTYGGQMNAWGRISQSRSGTTYYYGYDPGINVRQLFDASGAVTDTYTYDGFGNTVGRTGVTINPFQYRGEEFDAALGMYYLRARYYLPRTGRFFTADPYDGEDEGELGACDCSNRGAVSPPVGVHHLFSYGGAEPVGRIDPSGLRFIERAQIDSLVAFVRKEILDCIKNGVMGKIAEVGVYLLIGDFGVDVNPRRRRGEASNVYIGRTTRSFEVRFAEHRGTGKVFADSRTFLLPESIVRDRRKFAEFEQLVLDRFGGRLRTGNQINASVSQVFCD